jgi:transcriptional regulator with XRE-family HTH domain
MGSQQRSQGRTIAKKRRLLGLTQHQVAQAVGIGVNRLVFFETGRCTLLPEELDSIRSVLKKRAQKSLELVSA